MSRGEHKRSRVNGLGALVLGGVVVGLCGLAGGCGENRQAGTSSGRPLVGKFSMKDENPFLLEREKEVVRREGVHLIIYQVRIRDQEAGKAAELWGLFRPTQLVGNNAALLVRNGLAIGTGDERTWEQVAKMLKVSPTASQGESIAPKTSGMTVRRIETWLDGWLGAEIAVSGLLGGPTLFRYEADGRLVGKTYDESQKLLVLAAVAWPAGRSQVQLTPVLKVGKRRVKVLRRMAMVTQKEPEIYVAKFESLRFETLVDSGEFFMIGSSPGAAEMSFGRSFFDAVDERGSTQMLLLVIPRTVSAEQMK